MKYQIILSSDLQIPNDEFLLLAKDIINLGQYPLYKNTDTFKVEYAQNLEGVKREVWDKTPEPEPEVKEEDAKSIQDLFKIGD